MKSRSKAQQVGHQNYSAVAEQEKRGNSPTFSIDDQRPITMSQRHVGEMIDNYSSSQQPIQRRVHSFNTTTTTDEPPRKNLRGQINSHNFVENTNAINTAIDNKMTDGTNTNRERVTRIQSRLNGNVTTATDRSGAAQTNTGHYGRDEFLIRRDKSVMFEGGHIIPQFIWDDNDTNVGSAGDYDNLAPMTRTMNMIDWRAIENEFDTSQNFDYDIRIPRGTYNVTNNMIAKTFGLTVAANGGNTVTLNQWIPDDYSVNWTKATDITNSGQNNAEEQGMYKNYAPHSIGQGDGSDIQDMFIGYGVENVFTNAVWGDIGNL